MADRVDQLYERVLVLRCQAGDETAFAELVERFSLRLRYYLRRMLDHDEPDDLLQEVWLDVYRALPHLHDVGAFPAWLYRLARDRLLRRLRKRGLDTQPLLDLDVPANDDGPEFTAEDAVPIHAALAELPPEQREAIVLRYVQELSYDDIARIVGVPVGTVRSRLHNAKRTLRGILEREKQ